MKILKFPVVDKKGNLFLLTLTQLTLESSILNECLLAGSLDGHDLGVELATLWNLREAQMGLKEDCCFQKPISEVRNSDTFLKSKSLVDSAQVSAPHLLMEVTPELSGRDLSSSVQE